MRGESSWCEPTNLLQPTKCQWELVPGERTQTMQGLGTVEAIRKGPDAGELGREGQGAPDKGQNNQLLGLSSA